MSRITEQNLDLRRTVEVLAQRLFGEIEDSGDMNTIRRIATFGGPIAEVAENGGGYLEMFEAIRRRIEEIEWKLTKQLARAGFGPAERMALLPQIHSRLLGSLETQLVQERNQVSLPGGDH